MVTINCNLNNFSEIPIFQSIFDGISNDLEYTEKDIFRRKISPQCPKCNNKTVHNGYNKYAKKGMGTINTGEMTHYYSHQKRGSEAMNDMDILPDYTGTVVHDFWKPYYKYNCNHSICNAHLLRELTGISENYKQLWSKEMSDLLINIKSSVDEIREISGYLKLEMIKEFEYCYDRIVCTGVEENPPLQIRSKKRGRNKQTTAKNLLDRFMNYKNDIVRFMYDLKVPFENNLAERDVRMMRVRQKISGTFRSVQGARYFCCIISYISTVKMNQLSVMKAIQNAIDGKPFVPTIV